VNVDWSQIISAGAQVANAYAQSRARDRAAEASFNQTQDRTAQGAYATDKSLDLEALIRGYQAELDKAKGQLSEYETRLSAPQSRASNSVRGDILANVQDATVSAPDGVNVTTFGGGLRPSLLSGNSRALGGQMSKEALLDALSGSPTPFSNMAPVDLSSITGRSAPAQTELPQANTMDRVMEAIGTYGGMTSALLNSQRPPASGNQWLEGHGNNVYLSPPEQTRAASLLR
jgi:hypothetical protein